jgi:phosphatidylglycerol lysyltransferase
VVEGGRPGLSPRGALLKLQGLRQYKEKFTPLWQPKYLACRGGLALPRILTNIATLTSGGVAGVVKK